MLSIEYMVTGAYFYEGESLCPACGEAQRLPVGYSGSLAQVWEDWGDTGLWCDRCGAEIVPPPGEDEE